VCVVSAGVTHFIPAVSIPYLEALQVEGYRRSGKNGFLAAFDLQLAVKEYQSA
jgi:hypothetical protein